MQELYFPTCSFEKTKEVDSDDMWHYVRGEGSFAVVTVQMNLRDSGHEIAGNRELIVSFGWCGGMGEAVLKPPTCTAIQVIDGLLVFMTDRRIREYIPGLLNPVEPVRDPVRLRITGEFRLVKKTGRNDSIPGSPSETYWDAEIVRLDSIGIREDSQVWDCAGFPLVP